MSHFLRDMLHAAATLIATAAVADYVHEGRARRDAATEPELLTPTPIYDSVRRDLADLHAVESVDDVLYLWGVES